MKISLISQTIKNNVDFTQKYVVSLRASFLFPIYFPNYLSHFFFTERYLIILPNFITIIITFVVVHTIILFATILILAFDLPSLLYILYILYTSLRIGATTNSRGKRKTPRRALPSFPLRKNIEKRVVKS